MNKAILIAIALWALPTASFAQAGEVDLDTAEYQEARLRQQWDQVSRRLKVREIEQVALDHASDFEAAENTALPTHGKFGAHVFTYGAQVPKVMCRPLTFCDIQLQPGEKVQKVFAGDVARWDLNLSQSGAANGTAQHLMVKPIHSRGTIETNLIIHTDRRTYQIDLASPSKTPMRYVSFRYPEDQQKAFQKMLAANGLASNGRGGDKADDADSGEYRINAEPWKLHRHYEVEKQGRRRVRRRIDWAPDEADIFDDGHKTFIKMPAVALSRELPILVVVTKAGKHAVVEYRVKDSMFIVDRLFDRALLISDVGRHQERVQISRIGRRR